MLINVYIENINVPKWGSTIFKRARFPFLFMQFHACVLNRDQVKMGFETHGLSHPKSETKGISVAPQNGQKKKTFKKIKRT